MGLWNDNFNGLWIRLTFSETFLSQGVAESCIQNVQWDAYLSLLKGCKKREGKAMVRGTQV